MDSDKGDVKVGKIYCTLKKTEMYMCKLKNVIWFFFHR